MDGSPMVFYGLLDWPSGLLDGIGSGWGGCSVGRVSTGGATGKGCGVVIGIGSGATGLGLAFLFGLAFFLVMRLAFFFAPFFVFRFANNHTALLSKLDW